MTLCDMKCVNLNNETVKILGVHLSYNKNFEQNKNFCEHIVKIENDLNYGAWHSWLYEEELWSSNL